MLRLAKIALLIALVSPGPAAAKVGRAWLDARAALSRCLSEAEAEARGACLERATRALDAAEASGEGPLPTPEQARKAQVRGYGLRGPARAEAPIGGAEPRRSSALTTSVVRASQDGSGNWIMTTSEGAVWAQTDQSMLSQPPREGSSLTVRPGALGSFFCLINNRREVRCRRRS